MNAMKNSIVIFAIAFSGLVLCNGCALFLIGGAAAAGAGTVIYLDGQLKDTEPASLDHAHAATLAGLRDLQFAVVSDAKDGITDKIIARTGNDKKVAILLTKQADTITEIRIRVGTFGDEPVSRQVLEKIKGHL